MLNVVGPLAGTSAYYAARGVPIVQLVAASLRPAGPHRFHFVCPPELAADAVLVARLRKAAPGCSILSATGGDRGPAFLALNARDAINSAEPLIVAAGDRVCDLAGTELLPEVGDWDGSVTVGAQGEVEADAAGAVTDLTAANTAGVFAFRRGCDFVAGACATLAGTPGPATLADVCRRLIRAGASLRAVPVSSVARLATAADVAAYESRGLRTAA
jgi:hypothetical protein